MSGVSLPVNRPMGRALVVASPSSRRQLVAILAKLGFDCGECDDPYAAMLELCRRRLVYSALILSLASLYREELSIITTVKRRLPHVEIWLAHTDGLQAALAESMRLGADGLIDEQGLHRIALTQTPEPMPLFSPSISTPLPRSPITSPPPLAAPEETTQSSEPVLTAEELRALLEDQPPIPPGRTVEHEA